MSRRATVADIASAAGVSVATVDRVLNKRRPVRQETAAAVLAAAERLDYYGVPLLRQRAGALTRHLTLGFVLQKRAKPFYQDLAAALHTAAAQVPDVHVAAQVAFVDELSPVALIDQMRALAAQVDAMAVVAVDHPHITDEVASLAGAGIPVVTLLTQLSAPGVAGHVGTDGRKAGRTAAWALSRCAARPGPVGVFIGSHRYLGHEDREIGFRGFFREAPARFTLLETVAYLDDDAGANGAMQEFLAVTPNAAGLYIIGGGTAGAIAALRQEAAALAVVCHQLNSVTRDALIDGTVDLVIDTPVDKIAGAAVHRLTATLTAPETRPDTPVIPFDLYVSANI